MSYELGIIDFKFLTLFLILYSLLSISFPIDFLSFLVIKYNSNSLSGSFAGIIVALPLKDSG
ncbi:hypothetical protein NIES267_00410 [Calothrix parasitica NIES-267]|uniref:Uncharacterized protein n=1 Tax=Calothrix parasitica NIES-267 TaxID=1973488 RepID=A0A1Z4LHA2_9CYAN|nr:hypothetical protein NIES267_00410 [Calothrix parasitica NIES-267]